MEYMCDKNYTIKSLLELVRDETKRITSSNLATIDEFHKFEQPIEKLFTKCADAQKHDDLIDLLSLLHRKLGAVKLPGDFKKMAENMADVLYVIIENQPIVDDITPKCKYCDNPGPNTLRCKNAPHFCDNPECEHKAHHEVHKPHFITIEEAKKRYDEEKEKHETKEKDSKEDKAEDTNNVVVYSGVIETLEKIAYDLGKGGNHKAAFLVERYIREIEDIVK